jgi:N-acetylmuramoyl-L-alanine amidase
VFGPGTARAVVDFQQHRGLHDSGICDEATWMALAEAGWKLGDRLLAPAAPQQRGDDVAALQAVLNHLGFDCGRPDGIMGPATTRALTDFQRNSGLTADGVCGTKTVRMLELVARQSGTGPGVAVVRERSAVIGHGSMANARVVVGQFGGLSAITRPLARALRDAGATVMSTDEYDATAQAAAANRFGATVYLGVEAVADTRTTVSYFAVPTFESIGGRALARLIVDGFSGRLPAVSEPKGMRLPVLRETRMPAVLCTFGPVRSIVDDSAVVADTLARAMSAWITATPADD